MIGLLWNVVLAIIWVGTTGIFTPGNLVLGFVLAFFILHFSRSVIPTTNYGLKVRQTIGLAAFFVQELVLANLRVAYDVLTPRHHMRPGVIALPLDVQSDAEITLLSNLITLTPGSLSLDVSADRKVLYLHVMFIDDVELVRARIKSGFERRILELLR